MTGKKGLIKIGFIFTLVLILSAFRTVTARADDATPPPTAAPEVTQPTDDGSTVETQVAPTDSATPSPTDVIVTQVMDPVTPVDTCTATPVPTDETVTQTAEPSTPVDTSTATPPPTQVSSDAGTTATDETTQLISQIPQGSQLVLQSDNQPAIPLGSAEAANIIATGDPIWCPTGVAPKANAGGCTDSFDFFNGSFLTQLAGKATSGTIWIKSSYNSSPADSSGVTLGCTTLGGCSPAPTIVNYALTLQGGWSGAPGSKTISGSSTFGVPLTINWNADVTLNDLVVTGVASGNALTITTPKSITLNRVKVNNNAGPGAYLDNTNGGTGTGSVIVTSGQFNHNSGGRGLDVQSRGAITLSAVTADNNSKSGVYLRNATAASAKNVTLTSGPYEFNNNGGGYGIAIFSKGAIALKDLDALGNYSSGAYLNNTSGTGNVDITSGQFNGNTGVHGLEVYSSGVITLSAVTADTNSGDGAHLENNTAASPKNVTLTNGPYEFNGNTVSGLVIFSKGAIILKDIDALKNSLDGAYLDNTSATTAQAITLTGTNIFSENDYDGLHAYSNGPISANNLVANANGRWGADLENSTAVAAQPVVTLTGSSNQFNSNQYGLAILTKGNITLNNISASYNSGDPYLPGWASGAELDNCLKNGPSCPGTGNVTLTGINSFEGNFRNGLIVKSTGTIAISNLSADGSSHGYGSDLDNTYATSPKSITLTGSNQFNSNEFGLDISSRGNITLNSITARDNWGDQGIHAPSGANLDNCLYDVGPNKCTATGNVILTGTNSFEENYRTGLIAFSGGTITISNLSADGNGHDKVTPANSGGEGAFLSNAFSTTPKSITLTGANSFSDNYDYGIEVESMGAIAASNITANNTEIGYGVGLNNHYLGAVGSLTISGLNTFKGNGSTGLSAVSKGAISLNGLDAEGNGGKGGVWIDNSSASTPQSVTVSGTLNTFSNNPGGNGLEIQTKGAVTIANLNANGNEGAGVLINNQFTLASPQNVTLTGFNILNTNGDSGLAITTYGTIAANNLTASNNGSNHGAYGWGAYLDNCAFSSGSCHSTLAKSITLTSNNTFTGNYQDGIWATSMGPIKVNSLTAGGNRVDGAYLNDRWTGSSGGITLTGSNVFSGNHSVGLEAYSRGAISANNLTANDNTGNGVYLDNCDWSGSNCLGSGTVTLTGYNTFLNNAAGGNGLDVLANGNITVNNVTANGNKGSGVVLDNCEWNGVKCTGSGTIKLTGANTFSNNHSDGLYFDSHQAVTINHVETDENGGNGINGSTDGGSITVLGGSMTGNTSYGWQFNALTTVTLKGVFAYGNHGGVEPENNLVGGSLIIVRSYP